MDQKKTCSKQFYILWQNEYLASLSKNKGADSKAIKKEIVVLIDNEKHMRQAWPIARVTQVFPSKDGIVRSVECKMANAVKTSPTRKMQVTKIYCLCLILLR